MADAGAKEMRAEESARYIYEILSAALSALADWQLLSNEARPKNVELLKSRLRLDTFS